MGSTFLGLDEEQWFFLILLILVVIYIANIKSYEILNTTWPTILMVVFGLEKGYISLSPRDDSQDKKENPKNSNMSVTPDETVPEWENTKVGIDDLLKQTEIQDIKPHHMGEVDIDLYLDKKSIQDIHQHMGSLGDNRMANRMKYSAIQAKESHDSWSRMNSEKMRRIYEEELQEQENRDWWDAEQDYLDEYM